MSWGNQYRRSEKTRQAIQAAARELCREVGYEAVSIEAIARRAGSGKQTIYRWWPSKGAVLLDVLIEAAGDSAAFPDTGDVKADLIAQMSGVARLMSSADGPLVIGLITDAHHDQAVAERISEYVLEPRRRACLSRLSTAVERGELVRGIDTALLMEQLYGPLYYRFLVTREGVDDAHVRALIGALLDPLLPAPD